MHFTIHENNGEWVLRLHDGKGQYVGIGVLNGEDEAKAVYATLQGALEVNAAASELVYRSDDTATRSFWSGFRQANKRLEVEKFAAFFPQEASR